MTNCIITFSREEKDDSQKSQRTADTTDPSTHEVDEDGYVIRPSVAHNWNNEKGSFYSSSDSDTGKGFVPVTLKHFMPSSYEFYLGLMK